LFLIFFLIIWFCRHDCPTSSSTPLCYDFYDRLVMNSFIEAMYALMLQLAHKVWVDFCAIKTVLLCKNIVYSWYWWKVTLYDMYGILFVGFLVLLLYTCLLIYFFAGSQPQLTPDCYVFVNSSMSVESLVICNVLRNSDISSNIFPLCITTYYCYAY